MKKVATIFVFLVYLGSFAGIFLGDGCTIHMNSAGQSLNMLAESHDHESDASEAHPLSQVCNAIEFHKEVRGGAKMKVERHWQTIPAQPTFIASGEENALPSHFTGYQQVPGVKLFLFNRALLI